MYVSLSVRYYFAAKVSTKRSINQKGFMHVCVSWFSREKKRIQITTWLDGKYKFFLHWLKSA